MGAVFLSYASEDVAAAERIATALRNAGVQVWFDREELRGGDTWDRQIRQQIHDCRLFVAMVSAHTEARDEGYFRREWRLAVERAGDMAEGKAFLVPVVIDGTEERGAAVPDKFRELQWTRLPDGEASSAFVERVRRLLSPARTAATPVSFTSVVRSARGSMPQPWRAKAGLWVIGGVLAVALSYFVADRFWLSKRTAGATASAALPSSSAPEKSIAVLPFVDLSEKHDQEYFADGVAESLLDTLAKVPHLKVIGRTSSFQFKGKNEDLRSIGRQLSVNYLVEGSVRRSGGRTRVTAQLIDADSGAHRWSDTFDRDNADAFALQDEIAAAIARSLEITTAPVMHAHIGVNAYEELLRGRAEYDRNAWESARAHYRQALSDEPMLAEAAEGIVNVSWAQLTTSGSGSMRGGWETLRDAAQALLRIDPHSALGHAALGAVHAGFEYDWSRAEVELAAALAGPPPSADTLAEIAWLANGLGHRAKALDLLATAASIDPLSPQVYLVQGAIWLNSADYVRAEEPLRKVLALIPKTPDVHAMIAASYVLQRRPQDALAELAQEQASGDREATYAIAYHQLGRRVESDKALEPLLKDPNAFPYSIAQAYAMRSESDRAFFWLDHAYEVRSETLAMIVRSDPSIDAIRADPRYKALRRKMNLPE